MVMGPKKLVEGGLLQNSKKSKEMQNDMSYQGYIKKPENFVVLLPILQPKATCSFFQTVGWSHQSNTFLASQYATQVLSENIFLNPNVGGRGRLRDAKPVRWQSSMVATSLRSYVKQAFSLRENRFAVAKLDKLGFENQLRAR